jgi:hypothetical protein
MTEVDIISIRRRNLGVTARLEYKSINHIRFISHITKGSYLGQSVRDHAQVCTRNALMYFIQHHGTRQAIGSWYLFIPLGVRGLQLRSRLRKSRIIKKRPVCPTRQQISNILTYQQSLHDLKGNPLKHHYIWFRDAGLARSQPLLSTKLAGL